MSANTWEQLSRETSKAHKAFRMYLDLGPERSAVAVARQCGVNKSLVHRWSSRWRWIERAVEYDREQRAQGVRRGDSGPARHAKAPCLARFVGLEASRAETADDSTV